jgi:hypothetical protein
MSSKNYAIKDRDGTVHAEPSRKEAFASRKEYGGMVVRSRNGDEWKPYKKRRIFLWVFLAIQLGFLAWVIGGASTGSGIHGDTVAYCKAHPSLYVSYQDCLNLYSGGAKAGAAIGVGLIVIVWVIVDFLVALTYGIWRLARR